MNRCHVCSSDKFYHDFIDEVFYISGKPILVEHIPVKNCSKCSEQILSRQTTEKIRLMLHSKTRPIKVIPQG